MSDIKKIQTPSILYYCFSNGTINTDFDWPPEIKITRPEKNNLYIRDRKIIPWFSTRVIGPLTIKVEDTNENTNNIDYVNFYLDDVLAYIDNDSPYEYKWSPYRIQKPRIPFNNKCTIKTIIYDNNGYIITDSLTFKFIPPAVTIGGVVAITALLLLLSTS